MSNLSPPLSLMRRGKSLAFIVLASRTELSVQSPVCWLISLSLNFYVRVGGTEKVGGLNRLTAYTDKQ